MLRARIAEQHTFRFLFPNQCALRSPLHLYRFSTFLIRFKIVLGKLSQRLSSRKEPSSSTGRGRASPPRAWDGDNLSSFLHPPRVGEGFPHHGWWGRFSPLLLHERKPPSDQRASREVMPLPFSIHGPILNPLLFQQFSLRSSDMLGREGIPSQEEVVVTEDSNHTWEPSQERKPAHGGGHPRSSRLGFPNSHSLRLSTNHLVPCTTFFANPYFVFP